MIEEKSKWCMFSLEQYNNILNESLGNFCKKHISENKTCWNMTFPWFVRIALLLEAVQDK